MTGPIAQQTSGSNYVQPGGTGSSHADVVDQNQEKGLVIDLYARVSLVGIEILTIDVRIVVASVDTYLRFAEAVNRLDIAHDGTSQGLPQFVEGMQESGAKKKTRGALDVPPTARPVHLRDGDGRVLPPHREQPPRLETPRPRPRLGGRPRRPSPRPRRRRHLIHPHWDVPQGKRHPP
jgi:hypothetical protein